MEEAATLDEAGTTNEVFRRQACTTTITEGATDTTSSRGKHGGGKYLGGKNDQPFLEREGTTQRCCYQGQGRNDRELEDGRR